MAMIKGREIFGRHRMPGGIVTVIFVTLLLFGCNKDWKEYQKEYVQLLKQRDPASAEKFQPGLRKIGHKEIDVSDACLSCHLGVDNPAMAEAPQPFTTHPGDFLKKHDWEKIGCTTCHQGNGKAISTASAHRNLLPGELMQTTCHQCHPRDQKLPDAPQLTHGKVLFTDLQCSGCHYVEGVSPDRKGPSLEGIGSRVDRKWLKHWLMNPREMMPNARMPYFYLPEDKADALAAYLMTFRDPQLEAEPESPEGDVTEGGNLLRRARCISCHPFHGRGGFLGPDLGRIGNKTNRKFVFDKIKNPKRFEPNSTMPQFNFTDQEIANIVDYLFDEYTDYDLMDILDEDTTVAKNDSATIDLGRKLYKELRCVNCHLLNNGIPWLRLGPRLTNIGDKAPSEFQFGNSDIPRQREEYILEKIRNPRAFATPDHPQKMPRFSLGNLDAYDLTIFLNSLTTQRIKSERFAAYPDTSVYRPGGEFGKIVDKFQCFSCHRINGRGFNLAYDLSMEGSRVQRKWLYNYLMVSYSIRPILVERMPIFNFTPHEAEVLTDYIMKNLTSTSIPGNLQAKLTPELAAEGKVLFEKKGCMACHIRGDKGGYVGPSFTAGALAGDKLQAGWVFKWLKNPQAIVPGVLEPNYNLSDEEALAITAYLMSLKTEE